MEPLALFLCGVRDSVSTDWIRAILLFRDPQTREIHPDTTKLVRAISRLMGQVLLIYVLAPVILQWLAADSWFFTLLYYYALLLVTILTYGYTFFYFGDIFESVRNVLRWHKRRSDELHTEFPYSRLDAKQRNGIFTDLSNKIKSVVFLVSYVAIFVMCSKILIFVPYVGTFCLVASESFFNGAFYFLRKWPYDQFNLAFLEKQWAYLTGYGLIVSIVCNVIFGHSLILSNGAYFLMSVWLVINCVGSTPPQVTSVNSLGEVVQIVKKKRCLMQNSYNIFRSRLQNPVFQRQVRTWPRMLKFVIALTNKINDFLQRIYTNLQAAAG